MKNERLERLKRLFADGGVAICAGVFYTDSLITEQLGTLDFDMIWIDQEHTGFSLEILRSHIQAATLTGKVSIVRMVDCNPSTVKPVLELAPDAVIFPMVNTAEQARTAIQACLYPPEGIRGYGPIRAQRFWTVPMEEYLRDAASCFWRIVQIEHVEAVRNLEEILDVPGIDGVVVGPNDLSASIGLLGQYRHPEVLALMDRIAEVCRRRKIPFGAAVGYDEENIGDWIRRGASWLGIGQDVSYINTGAQLVIDGVQKILSKGKRENNV